ncbi:VWA domain-containing protein [Streptomyces sp. NBC_00190]|uniref:vWA domain-containing protein n=1 Tax=unclassified Streptomyces TaxID=2593676 RepID=UPI002E2BCE9C|nr:vWA domain-containing protein [Streptomyces sp. NBC_00190]WSZ38554.1 VWA domain-containing protein [Streptomyces sp. NBC_00868]
MARFDPRGRVNRALLVGVPTYEFTQPGHPFGVPGNLEAVEHNLVGLAAALREGGMFGEEEIGVFRPLNVHEFDRRLDDAVDEAEGLLLLYFSGHGAVPSNGDELWLLMHSATIEAGAQSVFRGAITWKSVLTVLTHTSAEHVVVVLDCCYAGNASAAWDALDTSQRQRISLLMSVQANNRIDAGDDATPTPFTAQLIRLLRVDDGHGAPVGFKELAEKLWAYMSVHHTTLREPAENWEPQSRPAGPGTDVLLAAGSAPDASASDGQGGGRPEDQADSGTDGPQLQGTAAETAVTAETDLTAEADVARVPLWGRRSLWPLPGSRRPRPADEPGRTGRPRLTGRTRVAAVSAAVLIVLAGLVPAGHLLAGYLADALPCKPPLELRLLTDPDLESTVRKATEVYLVSEANRTDDGCRRNGITVYSAGAAQVVAAFHDQSDPWQRPTTETVNPQRDIGPQPDIWIPATSASAARARPPQDQRSYAELLVDPAPFAYSPLVLAVPQQLAQEGVSERSGGLATLMDALRKREAKAEVRRPDPERTDSGLVATIGLYGAGGAGGTGGMSAAATAEHLVRQPGPPSPTSGDLLCVLPDDDAVDDRTAALVPEFLLKSGVGCHSTTRARRMAAYPDDAPGLDPTFVRVRWREAVRDEAARQDAVERFRAWLTGTGQGAAAGGKGKAGEEIRGGLVEFGKDGFRSAANEHRPLAPDLTFSGFGALGNPHSLAAPARQAAMATALKEYREASGPGRVLFLLDSSGSMGDLWQGPGGAPGIVKQSLGGLGNEDEYGVWAVAAAPGAPLAHQELLPFGRYRRGEAERAIDQRAQVKDLEADPYQALISALEYMTQRGADDDRPRLIVFITDDEDNNRLAEGGHLDALRAYVRDRKVPVVMASLDSGGCDKGKPDAVVSEATGGRCLDTRTDLVAGLRDEVARAGTGGAE